MNKIRKIGVIVSGCLIIIGGLCVWSWKLYEEKVFWGAFVGAALGFLSSLIIQLIAEVTDAAKEERDKKSKIKYLLNGLSMELNRNNELLDDMEKNFPAPRGVPFYLLIDQTHNAIWDKLIVLIENNNLFTNISKTYFEFRLINNKIQMLWDLRHRINSIETHGYTPANMERLLQDIEAQRNGISGLSKNAKKLAEDSLNIIETVTQEA